MYENDDFVSSLVRIQSELKVPKKQYNKFGNYSFRNVDDILESFNYLIRMCTLLMDKENIDEKFLKEIFTRLIHIGRLLNLSDEEIVDACNKKILKNEERLNNDY